MTEARQPNRAALSGMIVAIFLALGLGLASIGPAVNYLMPRWGVLLADGGILFTALELGYAGAVLLSGLLLGRLGLRTVALACNIAFILGGLVMAFAANLAAGLLGSALLGVGVGGIAISLNLLTIDLYRERSNSALNIFNAVFGLGAIAAPLLVNAALGWFGSLQSHFLLLTAISLLAALGFAFLRFPEHQAASAGTRVSLISLLREPYVLLVSLLFFLAIGLEAGYSGWSYVFASKGAQLDPTATALLVTTFWLAFTLGRSAAGLVAHWLSAGGVLLCSALLGGVGAFLVATLGSQPLALFVGTALVGFGVGPLFPTAFGLATAYRPAVAASLSAVGMIGGSLGGAILPYLQGQLLSVSLPLGAAFTGVGMIMVLGLRYALHQPVNRRPANQPLPTVGPEVG